MEIFRLLLAAALLSGMSLPVVAQRMLYEPTPPAGSAYVRVVNTLPGVVHLTGNFLPTQTLGTTSAERVGPYAVVERVAERQLTLELAADGQMGRLSFSATPGSYVTLVLQPKDGRVQAAAVIDQTEFNQLRAKLSFYNALPDCTRATLVLEPSGPAIFRDVPASEARTRSVNPVTAQVRASCGEITAAPLGLEGLEAGGTYSVWLMRSDGGWLTTFLSHDVTQPARR